MSCVNGISKRQLRFGKLASRILLSSALAVTVKIADAQAGSPMNCNPKDVRSAAGRVFDNRGQLLPMLIADDVFLLRVCIDKSNASRYSKIDGALSNKYYASSCKWNLLGDRRCNVGTLRMTIPKSISNRCVPPRGIEGACVTELLIEQSRSTQIARVKPFSASGGPAFGGFVRHLGGEGHYEITGRGLDAYALQTGVRIGNAGRLIVQDASRDADFYEWELPAAHAQLSFNDTSLELTQNSTEGFGALSAWVGNQLRDKLLDACKGNSPRYSAYWIGYALHAVQDMVFHEGMSNPEHSYRDQFASKVDTEFEVRNKMDLAVIATVTYLSSVERLLEVKGQGACFSRAVGLNVGRELSYFEKAKAHPNGITLGPVSLLNFYNLAFTMRDKIKCDGCDPDLSNRVVLRPKWLGWDSYKPDDYPTKFILKVQQLIHKIFEAN